jgi:DNA polymerase elongation subunit (family B)
LTEHHSSGHHFFGFDLDVLLHRMKDHKIADWSKLGRLKRKEMPRLSMWRCGRFTFQLDWQIDLIGR